MSDEHTHRIIRLKRYENPPKEYYEEFLREFHYRQRAELLKPSLKTLLLERFSSLMLEFRVPVSAYAGATALALLASVAIWRANPAASPTVPDTYASTYSQTPVTIQKMQPVSLRVDSPASADQSRLFPTSYPLQARPANHESPLSF